MSRGENDDGRAELLEEARRREKGQTLFYRRLAALAEEAGRADEAERLNGLHADEQHHLSRLTARLLEMGRRPTDLRNVPRPDVTLAGWEDVAREREGQEVAWYERALHAGPVAEETRVIFEEILASERHHEEELGGKWMSA